MSEITDDIVLEYVYAQKQIRRVLDEHSTKRQRLLDRFKPQVKRHVAPETVVEGSAT